MSEFIRFPRTPHLAWLGEGVPRDDKVLSRAEADALLSGELVLEEKLDGANVGLSVDDEGALRVQNRGAYIPLADADPQFKPLRHWLAVHRVRLLDALGQELILFGEWCYAQHSVPYDRLPDWFVAFDIFDRGTNRFWSVERRNRLLRPLDVAVVADVARGRFDVDAIRRLIPDTSCYGQGPAEGVYVRRDEGPFLEGRAKLVRPEFTQAIGEHWRRKRMVLNRLAPAARRGAGPASGGGAP